MKKIILPVIGIALTTLVFGQNAPILKSTYQARSAEVAVHLIAPQPVTTISRGSGGSSTASIGTIWFQETFSNGLSGDGTNGAWTTNGTVTSGGTASADPDAVWEYRGTATTPNNTIGSRGGYSATWGAITSSTVSNGFFIFDSDYRDNGGTAGNFGMGTAATPHKSWLISPSFSTVGSSNLKIDLTTFFRRFLGTCHVLLSTDNGVTWGDSIEVMGSTFAVNTASAPNELISAAIPFLENQATAKIALFFDGETISNVNGSGYYFAMVDDIIISDLPNNNLEIGDNYYQTGYDTGLNAYYSMIPTFLTSYDSIQFSAKVANNGTVLQENVVFKNTVTFNGNAVATMVSAQGVNLASGASDSLATTNFLPLTQGVGGYSFVYSVESDSTDDVPLNNFKDTVYLSVTDTTYARDAGATGNFYYGAGTEYEIGNSFEIYETVNATSVSLAVGSNTIANKYISVYVYKTSDLTTPITKKEFIALDAATIGSMVTYDVPDTLLSAGTYLVTYRTYSSDVYFKQSNYDGNPFMSYVNVSSGTWGWTTSVTPIRLNISSVATLCNGSTSLTQLSNDSIQVMVANGTAPFTYLWSSGDTTTQIGSLQNCVNYVITVTDSNACVYTDSITFVYHDSIDYNVCPSSSFTFADGILLSNVSTDTSYTSTLIAGAIGGCDSVVTQNLILLPQANSSVNYDVCNGGSFTYLDGTVAQNITSNTSHESSFAGGSTNGCDSVVTETLTVLPSVSSTIDYDICFGDTFTYLDGTIAQNVTSNTSHGSVFSGASSNGCDSTVVENLILIPAVNTSLNHNVCYGDPFTYLDGSQELNVVTAVSHVSVFVNATVHGCDSMVTEYLTPTGMFSTDVSICSGGKYIFYDGTVINDITSPVSHISIISGGAMGGCDSLIKENVLVKTIDVSVTVSGKTLMANLVGASYKWLDCALGTAINGATDRVFSPTIDGIYQVEVTDIGCKDTSLCYNVIVDGIADLEIDLGVSIYPNPVVDELKIDKGNNTTLLISIIDYTGKLVYESKLSDQQITINFKEFAAGVYLIMIDNGNQSLVKKLIKK